MIDSWNFDETSGSVAYDSVGTVNGILQGQATFVPGAGIQGGAIQLNATTDDLINMGDNFGFSTGDFSVEVWVKLNPDDTEPLMPVAHHYSGYGAGYFSGRQ